MAGGAARRSRLEGGALFGVALLFRLAYFAEFRHSPFFALLHGDPELYHQRALRILGGDLVGSGVDFHSSPIYPYFLALVYKLFGAHIPAVFVVQSAIGAGSALLLARVAERLGGRASFWIAGLALACWPILAYLDHELLEITLVLLGVHAMLFLLLREREVERGTSARSGASARFGASAWIGLSAGACLGLAVLGKPNSLLFLPLWIAWQLRRGWRRLLPFALGCVIVIAPFTLKNRIAGGDWVLTSSNGGINLYIGNNPQANGTFAVPARMEADLFAASKSIAEEEAGRPLRPSEVSSRWAAKAMWWIGAHPGDALRLYGRKLLLLVNQLEVPNHFDANFLARDLPLLRVSPFRFGLWLPFALWGIALAVGDVRRGRGDWDLPLAWLVAYALSLLPFFITERYRLPAVTVLLVFAARGMLDLWARARRWREVRNGARTFALGATVVAIGFVLAWLPLARAEDFFPSQYQILGGAARDRGDFAGAASWYREALALEPRSVLAHNSLGTSLARLGRTAEAAREFEAATAIDPSYAPAWRNLARWRGETQGPAAEEECLTRAITIDAGFLDARRDLAKLLLAGGRYPEALTQLDLILAREPADRASLWNRALVLGRFLGRPAESLATLDQLDRVAGPSTQSALLRAELRGR